MRNHRFLFIYSMVFILSITTGFLPLKGNQNQSTTLEQYLEIELKRLDETYCLMDRFAEKIWPGWNNFHDVEFRVRFPNNVNLTVNPRQAATDNYKLIPGRTVKGKPIYIDRSHELPMKVTPPLNGGGGGGMIIRIRLRQKTLSPEDLEKAKNPPHGEEPFANSEDQILINVHEFFHGFQAQLGAIEKEGDALYKFKVNTPYAVYSNVEGLALLDAYGNQDKQKALEALQDCYVAWELKTKSMPPEAVISEQSTRMAEGTAVYSNTKMAMLIRDSQYTPTLSQKDDPFFYNYKYLDAYIENELTRDITDTMAMTLDKVGKCYAFGAGMSYALDRFVPNWKQDFFQEKKTLEQAIGDFLKLTPAQKETIAQRLKTKYPYEQIYARHHSVIKERDDAIQLVNSRKGKTYIVDFTKTREFPTVTPRGKSIRIDVEQLYLNGIEELVLKDVELVSLDTPIHRTWLYTFQWVDTKAEQNKKGYQLSYKEKEGDTYKHLVFKNDGFTLKAPEAQVIEDSTKNEVRILVLSKVAR